MKKFFSLIAVAAFLAIAVLPVVSRAEDKAETVTLTGDCMCGKCSLHETEKCQNVLETTVEGKKVKYYLKGKESKAFHSNVCSETKKVTVTGTVKEVEGKKQIEVTKIELAK